VILCFIALALARARKAHPADPPRATFDKAYVTSIQNAYRHSIEPTLKPLTWSNALENKAWALAKRCSLPALLDSGNDVLASPVAYQAKAPLKYSHQDALLYIEDNAENTCAAQITDPNVESFGCAIARCPKLASVPKGEEFFRGLTKETWDAVVCQYSAVYNGKCFGAGKNGKVAHVGQPVHFDHEYLTSLENELRKSESCNLDNIHWDPQLAVTAYHRAKACNPKPHRGPNEIIQIFSGVHVTSIPKADVSINIQTGITAKCPNMLKNPKLTKYGCAGVICGRRPHASLTSTWLNFICHYDEPTKTCNSKVDKFL